MTIKIRVYGNTWCVKFGNYKITCNNSLLSINDLFSFQLNSFDVEYELVIVIARRDIFYYVNGVEVYTFQHTGFIITNYTDNILEVNKEVESYYGEYIIFNKISLLFGTVYTPDQTYNTVVNTIYYQTTPTILQTTEYNRNGGIFTTNNNLQQLTKKTLY